jgi:hypothetical protein
MIPSLENKEIHSAILHLRGALARVGSLSASKVKVRIVFASQEDCLTIKDALIQEIELHETYRCKPPCFRICGVDVALLTEDR